MHVSSAPNPAALEFGNDRWSDVISWNQANNSSMFGSAEPLTEEAITELLFDIDEKFIAEAYSFNLGESTAKKQVDIIDACCAVPSSDSIETIFHDDSMILGLSNLAERKPESTKRTIGETVRSLPYKRRKVSDAIQEKGLKRKYDTEEMRESARTILSNKSYIDPEPEPETKAPKIQPCVPFVPDYVTKELTSTSGEGRFTTPELLCCLLFAYTESLKANSYATIKMLMGDKRSRGSIRRKVEKIVKKETGIKGGLLGIDAANQQLVLEALWDRFMRLAEETNKTGSPELVQFTTKLCQYAHEHCRRKK